MGSHPTENYGAGIYNSAKQEIITKQYLRSKIIGIWINNLTTTDAKRKLRAFRTAYTFKTQDYGDVIFFCPLKMVRPETRAG